MDKVVVTGVSSFVGAHLASFLSKIGYNVVGTGSMQKPKYCDLRKSRINYIESVGCSYSILNILDRNNTDEFINKHSPEYWFHLPAWTKNYGSYEFNLDKAYEINVKPLVSKIIDLEEAPYWFNRLSENDTEIVKVIIRL